MTTMAPSTEPNSGEPEELPSWAIPPKQGFVAEDLDRIPELPPHTELIYGSLVFVSPQMKFHLRAVRLLELSLLRITPSEYEVIREMTVKLGARLRVEPDIMLTHADADRGMKQTTYMPENVVLVAEVVSDESEERDRKLKPRLYAEAGIPHMWRVEEEDGIPVVYTYELDSVTRSYAPTGVHHERLNVSVPFDIDIDLTRI